jgi:predicted alpha/beta hydrolase
MPFHSVGTEQEALDVIVLHCHLGHFAYLKGVRRMEYRVTKDWADDDLPAALASARRQCGLPPKE